MPRGRPKKEVFNEKVIKEKKLPDSHNQVGEIKKKKAIPPKRRGRKKKNQELLMKPEDVLDFIDRNYPKLGIKKIKKSIIEGLENRDQNIRQTYVLDEIIIAGEVYYCDSEGNILNDDARLCGFIVDSDTDSNEKKYKYKMYKKAKTQDRKNVQVQMFYADADDRTYKQVIGTIGSNSK